MSHAAITALRARIREQEAVQIELRVENDLQRKQIKLLESDVARLKLGPDAIEAKAEISRLRAALEQIEDSYVCLDVQTARAIARAALGDEYTRTNNLINKAFEEKE